MEWDHGLLKSDIMSLLHMPHFGSIAEVNTCVKKLLLCFHGGCLWLDTKVYVDVH